MDTVVLGVVDFAILRCPCIIAPESIKTNSSICSTIRKTLSMSKASQTIREKVHALAEELPPDAPWDDVIEEARFRKAVELGIAAADRGAFATDEEVRDAFARWRVKS